MKAAERPRIPGLLVVWHPPGIRTDRRASLHEGLVVGRSSSVRWCIRDDMLSRSHFEIRPQRGQLEIRDLGSRNGTYVGGEPLAGPRFVAPGTVIRAGGELFMVVEDLAAVASPGEGSGFGIVGEFFAPPLVQRLRVAARTDRHLLIEGETGSGKELAAGALHALRSETDRPGPLVPHNAARFAGEQDAVTALFGVVRGAFTGVEARPGAIEAAHGGTLFLDEVHNLPVRVQRSLLRFIEDGRLQRVGETGGRTVDARVILGTNVRVEEAVRDGRLAHDLVARLHRITLPPLRDRRADVPSLVQHLLETRLEPPLRRTVEPLFDAAVFERLCLHEYRAGNVRELQDFIAVLAARLAEGVEPAAALAASVADLSPARPEDPPASEGVPRSLYERHKAEIVSGYYLSDGNLSRLEKFLRNRGIQAHRRWLAVFLDRWGVRSTRPRG